jgi:hypothetical protein
VVTTRLREAAVQGTDRRMVEVGTFIGEEADIDCAAYRQRLVTRLLSHVVPGERELPDDHQRIVTAT